ncbi:MAG: sigma factor, partial [Planctomycetota bacterium]
MMTRKDFSNEFSLEDAILSVREGNTAAFEIVVRQFERPLRAWLAVQGPPGIDVDEVAQRSFVTAFTRLGDYETGTNFAAWLYTIARFQLKTEMTRLRRVADYHVRYAP